MNDHGDAGRPVRPRWWVMALCAVAATVFVGANAHLIYVSILSQPECVPHIKAPIEGSAQYRAATSSC